MTSRPIPGDKSQEALMDEMIRVDHAGEIGARQIYAGQLAILGKDECAPVLKEMAEQETRHLEAFEQLMRERKTRPTALLPFWKATGFALGAGTALMGKKAAMACTVAVETVIAEHYAEQIDALDETEKDLKRTLTQFRQEEQEHHDIGIAHDAEQAPFYNAMSGLIKRGCRTAIWIAKRI